MIAMLGWPEITGILAIVVTLVAARGRRTNEEQAERLRRANPDEVLPWIAGVLGLMLFLLLLHELIGTY